MIDELRTPTAEPKSNTSQNVGIFDIGGLIRRRKWLILFGLVTGLGLAGLYYSQAMRIYESNFEVLVMPKNQNLPSANANANMNMTQEVVDEGTMSTHVQLLKSPKIILAALFAEKDPQKDIRKDGSEKKKVDLIKLRTFQEAIAEAEQHGQKFDPVEFITKDHLTVTTGGEGKAKDARVLIATFRGPYAEDNVAILDALVREYQAYLGKTFSNTSEEAVKLITKASKDIGTDLAEMETNYQEFRKNAPLFWKGKESLNLHQDRLAKIEESLTELQQRKAETNARLQVIDEALAKKSIDQLSDVEKLALLSESDVTRLTLLVDVSRPDRSSESFQAGNPIRQQQAQAQYEKLLSLMLEEAKLLEDYGADHPKVKSIREQIRLTQEFLKKNAPEAQLTDPVGLKPAELLTAHLGLLRHDMAEIEKRKTDLEQIAKDEEKAAKELVVYELQGETMRGEIERKKELYETVIERLREISLIKDYGGYITDVIAPATVPDKQASPKLLLVMGLGGVLGLFFGGGLAFLVDMADKTFRDPDEVCHALDLPILAHMPRIKFGKLKRVTSVDGTDRQVPQSDVIVYHDPNSFEAEAVRGLRTALYFGQTGLDHKVIQVTSPNPSDGKTTVAANLAVTAANAGKRVLMIDADLRRPRLERLFHATSDVGLAEVLAGDSDWFEAVQPTGVSNLWILPCGSLPSNPSELLTVDQLDEFLSMAREHYDLVIMDSPPLLAVSDAAIIAPRVDGVLLTIRISKNGGPAAIHAKEMLDSVGGVILGVVVNDVEENRSYRRAYYGRKYGYGYGYGYGSKYRHKYYAADQQESNGRKHKDKDKDKDKVLI